MGSQVTQFKCLLASPADVADERQALSRLVAEWNAHVGSGLGCRVELVKWETHVTPELGTGPQEVINRQAVDDCDFAVALFWSRVGTPTETHPSGTVEEIERLREQGAHVLAYFCTRPISQDALAQDPEEFKRLQELKARLQAEGVYGTFGDVDELERKFQLHLTSVVTKLLLQERGDTQLGQPVTTAPMPDVRVVVQYGFVPLPDGKIMSVLGIAIQNHSPSRVFMGNVYISTRDSRRLLLMRDALTAEHQKRRQLEPGEAFTMSFDPSDLTQGMQLDDLVSAGVRDDIGRSWTSDADEFREALQMWREQVAKHGQAG